MKEFNGKLAIVTGGGTGMGRELVRQLAADGAHVAMCDVSEAAMAETARLADAGNRVRITSHVADVANEADMLRFRDEVQAQHGQTHAHLLFNNAGIGGGGSFVAGNRAEWERTFSVCWEGVYLGCRTFIPMLVAAEEGHVINTSSVNGFWGSIGRNTPHTAYVAAKFAVKGFTEALMTDLRINAPHVKASVVMPGHIGTPIVANSSKILGMKGIDELDATELAQARDALKAAGLPVDGASDADIRAILTKRLSAFEETAPTSAAQAAKIILDGVRAGKWRILVGDDAHDLDAMVRAHPEEAYEQSFIDRLMETGHWQALTAAI